MCSSSAARWNVSVPASSTPARRTAAAAASAEATGPFMSAEPRPINRPSSTTPSHGPWTQFDGSPTGTTSRCPFQAREGRSPEPKEATTLGRPSSLRTVSGDPPIAVRMSEATAAATSSVPPGFSLGAAINARANARTSSASTAPAAASARPSSTMALDGTRHPVANGAPRRAGAGPVAVARPAGSPGGRPRAPRRGTGRLAGLHRALERPVTARGRDLVPGWAAGSRRDAQRNGAP